MSLEWIILKDGQYHVFHIQCDDIPDDVTLAKWLTFQLLDHHWLVNTSWLSNFRFVYNFDPTATDESLINKLPDIRDSRNFARWILRGGDLVTYYDSPLNYCPQIGFGVSYQLIMEGDKITFGTVDPGYWIQWSFKQLISYTQAEIFGLFECVVNHWLEMEQQAESEHEHKQDSNSPMSSPPMSPTMMSRDLSASPTASTASSSSSSTSTSTVSTRSSPRRRRRRYRFVRRAAASAASAIGLRHVGGIGEVVEWLVDAVTSIFG